MKQRKSKLIKWLAGVALCTALISTATGVAFADTVTPISEADYQIEMIGAEIRTDDHYGIRFKATTKAVREDSKYYVMIVPEAWLTDTAHDLQNAVDGDYYAHLIGKGLSDVDDPATENVNERDFITMQTEPEKISDNLYELKGTISNVHFTNSNTKFFGIAYEQMANGTRNYAERNDKSVRSICWVAGAALNDETFDGDKTNLKPTIDRAYDYITNGAETGATLDLSKVGFKQNSHYTLDKGSVTKPEMVGLPEDLDLPIEYSVTNYNADVMPDIAADGVLTIKGETGCSFVKAQIAGATKNLTVYNTPQMAEGMLNDFASGTDESSPRTYDMCIYGTDIPGGRGYWLDEYTDAYGNKGYGVGKVTSTAEACGLRLNVSRAELEAMEFETITVRFLITTATSETSKSLAFFGTGAVDNPGLLYKSYPVNTWSYYTITKPTGDAWDTFLDTYCNSGVGRKATNSGGIQVYNGSGTTIYIDYICVGTQRMAEHELENFNVSLGQISNHIASVMSFTNLNGNNSTLLETQADGDGVTALKVAKLTITSGAYGIAVMRFAKTAEELTAILETVETMTWRVMVDKDQTLNILGNAIPLTANKWTDVTLTKAQLLANFTGANDAEKIATFASCFCSTGTALVTPRMFSVPSADCPVVLYVDGVTYTASAAE